MTSKLGWHTEGHDLAGRRDIIKTELTSYRANWHLCLGDIALARDLTAHVDKGQIYRDFDPFNEWSDGGNFDNTFWQNHTPQEVINYLLSHYSRADLDKFIWTVGNNEPTTAGQTAEFVAWCVALAHLGKQHNIRFAIAEIASAKSVHHSEVRAGVWDDLIRVLDQYRGFHIFTIHEYTTGILPASLLPDYPRNLNNPQALHKNNWHHAKLNLDSVDGNYHLGRGALVSHVRAKQIGIEPLPFVVTECAFDWMSDIDENHDNFVTNTIKSKFTQADYDLLRGSTGHRLYHEWLMRETGYAGDWNDYLFDNYRWLVNAYPDECEGFTIFALNHDWDKPEGHDMSRERNDKFRQLVITHALTNDDSEDTTPMEPVWNPELFDYDVSVTDGYWNLRAAMSASSGVEILGRLTTEKQRMKVSKETKSANNYDWYKFQQGDTTGYFANTDKLVLERVEDAEPPADDEPPTDDTPEPDTDAIDALQARVDALEGSLQSIMETLGGIGDIQKTDTVDLQLGFTVEVAKILRVPLGMTMVGLGKTLVSAGYRMQGVEPPHTDMTASFVADAVYKTDDANETVEDFFANSTPAPDATETTVTDVPDEDCEEAA